MKKKIIRPEGPAKKIILLRFCLKKIFWPGLKTQAPPEYQMDRALARTCPKVYCHFWNYVFFIHVDTICLNFPENAIENIYCFGFYQNYQHPYWEIIFRNSRWVNRFIFCQKYVMYFGFVFPYPFEQVIPVVEGWLLLDIGYLPCSVYKVGCSIL